MIPHISFEAALLGLVLSDTTVALIIGQIPLTLAAIASLIVSIRNGGKADKIAHAVDGTASKLQEDLATANGRIEQLMRFYPSVSTPGAETERTPAKVEIVQPVDKPVPVEPVVPENNKKKETK